MNLMKMFGIKSRKEKINEALAKNAVIVDVRTTAEFKQGHVKGSINIPLDRISSEANNLQKKGVPVITCCQSGMRSASAANMLKAKSIDAINGGGWSSLRSMV